MSRLALTIRVLLLVSCVLLGLGLVAPCMTIQPSFGEYTGWVKLLDPDMTRPSTYSVFSGSASLSTTASRWAWC